MDEKGFQMGQTVSDYVVFDKRSGPPIALETGVSKWVSIIECMSYRVVLKPYIIHIGKEPESGWFLPTTELPDWIWAFSPKGWTDNELAVDWLRRIFISETSSNEENHRILILDGHKSHVSGEFQWECLQNNMHPIYLPAHASYRLQPLDVGPFSPLGQYYGKAVQQYTPTGYATLNRATFANIYNKVREEAFSERNIRAGWRRTGIWPRNKDRILQDPEVQNFDRTTPDFYPKSAPNGLFDTPKKPDQYEAILSQIEHNLSPSSRVKIRKLGKGAIQESSVNLALNSELYKVRKQDKNKEVNKRTQRLQKEKKQRSLSMREIREARRAKGEPIRARIAYKTEEKLIMALPIKGLE